MDYFLKGKTPQKRRRTPLSGFISSYKKPRFDDVSLGSGQNRKKNFQEKGRPKTETPNDLMREPHKRRLTPVAGVISSTKKPRFDEVGIKKDQRKGRQNKDQGKGRRKIEKPHDAKCETRQRTLDKQEALDQEFRILKQNIVKITEKMPENGMSLGSIKSELKNMFPELLRTDNNKSDHPLIKRLPEVLAELRKKQQLLLLDRKYHHIKLICVENLFDEEKQKSLLKKLDKAKTKGMSYNNLKKKFKPESNLKVTLLHFLEEGKMVQKVSSSKLFSTSYVK